MQSTRLLVSVCLFCLVVCPDATLLGSTESEVECTCPLCKTKFTSILDGSGTASGRRLDLKPVGAIVAPWRLPVCPKCRFVQFKDTDKFTADELKVLGAFVRSDAYKSIPAEESSYYKVGRIFEHLQKPAVEIAHIYLKASWQVEQNKKRHRAYLEKSLEHFGRFLAKNPRKDDEWKTATFLRGELLRQLGNFDEAKKHFLAIQQQEEFKTSIYPRIIAQELDLIGKKDGAPQTVSK